MRPSGSCGLNLLRPGPLPLQVSPCPGQADATGLLKPWAQPVAPGSGFSGHLLLVSCVPCLLGLGLSQGSVCPMVGPSVLPTRVFQEQGSSVSSALSESLEGRHCPVPRSSGPWWVFSAYVREWMDAGRTGGGTTHLNPGEEPVWWLQGAQALAAPGLGVGSRCGAGLRVPESLVQARGVEGAPCGLCPPFKDPCCS